MSGPSTDTTVLENKFPNLITFPALSTQRASYCNAGLSSRTQDLNTPTYNPTHRSALQTRTPAIVFPTGWEIRLERLRDLQNPTVGQWTFEIHLHDRLINPEEIKMLTDFSEGVIVDRMFARTPTTTPAQDIQSSPIQR